MDEKVFLTGEDRGFLDRIARLLSEAGYSVEIANLKQSSLIAHAGGHTPPILVEDSCVELLSGEIVADPDLHSSSQTSRKANNADTLASLDTSDQSLLLESIANSTKTHLALLDTDFRFRWANTTYIARCGLSMDELIGRSHFELFPNDENQAIFEEVKATGHKFETEEKPFVFPAHPEWGVSYWDWTLTPVCDSCGCIQGFVLSLVEVTEKVQARKEVERLRQKAESRASEAEESGRILETIMDFMPEGVFVVDWPEGKIRMLSQHGKQLLGIQSDSILGMPMDEAMDGISLFRSDGVTPLLPDETPILRAISRGEALTNKEYVAVRKDGQRVHLLCNACPIRSNKGEIIGAISVFRDIKTLKLVHAALKEAYEREHKIADVLQHAVLPEVSMNMPGVGIAASYHPALSEAEVGGDFYDVFHLSHGRIAVVMGDVSGKGLDAAVHTAMAKYMLRAYVHQDPRPSYVMERLNEAVCAYTPDEIFITIFYGILDPAERTLIYTGAGHDRPLHYSHTNKSITPLDVTGAAIGIMPEATYRQSAISLAAGDILLFYTDGITDARHNNMFFGTERLMKILTTHAGHHEGRIVKAVVSAAMKFARGKLRDDAAVLAVKVMGVTGPKS
jgi:PAS domain S-box-containing protein